MQLNALLSRFIGVKKLPGEGHYAALCPCHNDHKPSLDIKTGAKGIVMACPVCGADGRAVAQMLGFDVRELFYEQTQRRQAPPSVDYMYSDKLKKTRFYRWDPKKQAYEKSFCWYHKQGDRWEKGLPTDKNGSKLLPPLYRAENIAQAVKSGKPLYIAEGEKDVDTLTDKLGCLAVCSPHGAGQGRLEHKWSRHFNSMFKGADVAVLADNDDAGRALADYIAQQLLPVARTVKLPDLSFEWENLPQKGDITDVYENETPLRNMSTAQTVAFRLEALTIAAKPLAREPGAPSPYIRMSDVESTDTEWLWYPYIPLGKITLMTADPGTGKTFLALYLAAQVSTGRPFYGENTPYREPAVAVYQTAEDGIADTIKPRLTPMHPNFNNIYVLNEEQESLSLSDERIEQTMRDLHPRLMIFDPLQAYLGAQVDMHRANEVRPVLGRIGHLAEKYHCAVVFVMHNSKASQNTALHRALGSVDIPAVARSMLVLGKNPDNPDGRILCHEKSSLAAHGKSLLFEIAPHLGGVVFGGFSDLKADDILNLRPETRAKPSKKRDELCDKIMEMFGDEDEIEVPGYASLCKKMDSNASTLRRAVKELGITVTTTGFGKDKITRWSLLGNT